MATEQESRTKHLNTYLIDICDGALAEAVQAVQDGKAAQVDVAMSFSVLQDEKEGLIVRWRMRDVDIHKGTWKPSAFGQMTLIEEG